MHSSCPAGTSKRTTWASGGVGEEEGQLGTRSLQRVSAAPAQEGSDGVMAG